MKYKYTRKEVVKRLKKEGCFVDFLKYDLLAQKEDKKECKHQYLLKQYHCYCVVCGKSTKPAPSPLEFEEIEEMKVNELSYASYNQWAKIMNKINSLISNQKKLYQLIKEKL